MEVGGITSDSLVVDARDTGFNALKAEDFLEMLIVQLQNQDPTEPVSNDQLLAQISSIRDLQSSIELSEAITSSNAAGQLATGANFIGKQVTAGTSSTGEVSGLVERAFTSDGEVFLTIAGTDVPLDSVTAVNAPTE